MALSAAGKTLTAQMCIQKSKHSLKLWKNCTWINKVVSPWFYSWLELRSSVLLCNLRHPELPISSATKWHCQWGAAAQTCWEENNGGAAHRSFSPSPWQIQPSVEPHLTGAVLFLWSSNSKQSLHKLFSNKLSCKAEIFFGLMTINDEFRRVPKSQAGTVRN